MLNKNLWKILFQRVFVCSFLILTIVVGVQAQTAEDAKNEFSIWGGASPDSSTVFSIGRTSDARYGTIGLRYARRFNNSDTVNLKYTVDAIPAAVINYPDFEFVQTGANTFRIARDRRTAFAFGVAPLGLQINFRPRKKLQPFISMSGGLLYFDKQIPRRVGTRFIFTADLGAGLELKLKNNRAVTVGYKYLHLSNGERGLENPGFDHNLFYVGYSFFR